MGDIYVIANTINKMSYVGQARHWIKKHDKYVLHGAEGRFKEHLRKALSRDECSQIPKLYNAIREHGQDNFKLFILESCNVDTIDERELFFIKKYDTINKGYNSSLMCSSGLRVSNIDALSSATKELWKDNEYREKQTESHIETWATQEYRENYFAAIKGRVRKNGLPYNIYARRNRKGELFGYEVTVKRNKQTYAKVFSGSPVSMEENLQNAIVWRDEIIKQLGNG